MIFVSSITVHFILVATDSTMHQTFVIDHHLVIFDVATLVAAVGAFKLVVRIVEFLNLILVGEVVVIVRIELVIVTAEIRFIVVHRWSVGASFFDDAGVIETLM
jgi:hypothetical protein